MFRKKKREKKHCIFGTSMVPLLCYGLMCSPWQISVPMTIVALHRSLLQCLTSASLCALIFINLCKNASFCSEIVDKLHSRRRYFLGSVWACLQCIISCYYGNYRKESVVTKRLKSIFFLKKIESSTSWLLFLILLLCIFRINQQKIW